MLRTLCKNFFVKLGSILIVTVFDWHRTILDPLVGRFREWRDVDYASTDEIAHGWRPTREPDLVIVCDAGAVRGLRDFFSSALFMHVGHGLISKNQTAYHYREADFVCVASQHVVERLTGIGHAPRKRFFATGLIQTDPLFLFGRSREKARRSVCDATVVYAPTWNDSLTSAAMFGDALIEKIRGENNRIRVVIKPHPHINVVRPEWIQMWSQMSQRCVNVDLLDPESDLIPTLLEADVMVSDASSAIFHFLALNRPIVLVNNPDRFHDDNAFDPNGIEWLWRDIADEVNTVDEVAETVRQVLDNPVHREHERLHRRQQLFGGLTDGRSCERVHSAAVHVLEKYR